MVQAAGMYNTLLQGDDPAVVIECLNGYRLKEKLPDNLKEFTVPLGKVDVLQEGRDITLVTYGSCIRIAQKAIVKLQSFGIEVELIDAQTLLPFDMDQDIVKSVQKTNKLLVLDEDVPGGASAYMMQQILEVQNGYAYLDSKPVTITAKANRPPYGSDGDYFVKPNAEDVIEAVYTLMSEYDSLRFPVFPQYR
jgi:pyruvate/2-oxoglutarate/acetoin dehydrogenase E1 component